MRRAERHAINRVASGSSRGRKGTPGVTGLPAIEPRRVAVHQFDLLTHVGEDVGAEFLLRRRGRDMVDTNAGQQSHEGQGQQHMAGTDLVPAKTFRHRRPCNRANDDGEKRPQFDDAVAPRQAFRRQQFREQAVLRRP